MCAFNGEKFLCDCNNYVQVKVISSCILLVWGYVYVMSYLCHIVGLFAFHDFHLLPTYLLVFMVFSYIFLLCDSAKLYFWFIQWWYISDEETQFSSHIMWLFWNMDYNTWRNEKVCIVEKLHLSNISLSCYSIYPRQITTFSMPEIQLKSM